MPRRSEKEKERQRETQRTYRQQKRARGFCVNGGCWNKSRNYYCLKCAQKYARKKQAIYRLTKLALKERSDAFRILSDFKGDTLLERAISARKYFEATESALL